MNTKQMNSFGHSDPPRALYSVLRQKTNEQQKTNELFHSRHFSFQDPKKRFISFFLAPPMIIDFFFLFPLFDWFDVVIAETSECVSIGTHY